MQALHLTPGTLVVLIVLAVGLFLAIRFVARRGSCSSCPSGSSKKGGACACSCSKVNDMVEHIDAVVEKDAAVGEKN
ncbi:hypothetical protein HMPREF3190_01297 [Umbribacter vaginalis]|jgi:hypothetical protein|nr:hypothetical protein HMPREF3190_01297 [Coriobacteriales bacterium DNF00809]